MGTLQWQEFSAWTCSTASAWACWCSWCATGCFPGRALLGAVVLAGCLAVLLAGPVWQARSMARLPLWLGSCSAQQDDALSPTALVRLSCRRRSPLPALDPGPGRRAENGFSRSSCAPAWRWLCRAGPARAGARHPAPARRERPSIIFFLCRLGFVLLLVAAGLRTAQPGRAGAAHPPGRAQASSSTSCTSRLLYHPLPGGDLWSNCSARTTGLPRLCGRGRGALLGDAGPGRALAPAQIALHPQAGPRLVQAFLGLGLVVFVCG